MNPKICPICNNPTIFYKEEPAVDKYMCLNHVEIWKNHTNNQFGFVLKINDKSLIKWSRSDVDVCFVSKMPLNHSLLSTSLIYKEIDFPSEVAIQLFNDYQKLTNNINTYLNFQ